MSQVTNLGTVNLWTVIFLLLLVAVLTYSPINLPCIFTWFMELSLWVTFGRMVPLVIQNKSFSWIHQNTWVMASKQQKKKGEGEEARLTQILQYNWNYIKKIKLLLWTCLKGSKMCLSCTRLTFTHLGKCRLQQHSSAVVALAKSLKQ